MENKYSEFGTIVNIDNGMPYHLARTLNGDWSDIVNKAKNHIECYRDSGITDLVFAIFCQSSVTDSKIFTKLGDNYNRKIENGKTVDYTDTEYIAFTHKFDEIGLNIFDLWIKHSWEMGIRPWISFRMNDAHYVDADTSFLRSDFFYEAKANGWLIGNERYGGCASCFDYAVPEVRAKMLAYIKEQLFQFDVYGFELDFMRNPSCFDFINNPECYKIMNQFMEEVKLISKEAEEHWGHELKIMVRLCRNIEHNKKYGFDIKYWAEKSLVDVVVPTAFWATSDTDMPIKDWVELLNPYGVKVCAGLEGFIFKPLIHQSIETMKAQIVQYKYQGASQIYLFNFFGYDIYYTTENTPYFWKLCSDLNLAKQGERRYVMTRQDDLFDAFDDIWKPLPCDINEEKTFELHTGYIANDEKVTLYLDVDDVNSVDVYFNNIPATLIGKGEDSFAENDNEYSKENIMAYIVQQDKNCEATQILTIKAKNKTTVRYIELKVEK